MIIALIGATGRVGSRLATELLSDGHAVTGIALHVPPDVRPGLTVLEADATRPDSLAPRLMGHDGVISALRFVTSDADALIAAVKTAGVKRLLVVSGAGSLEIAPGKTLMDTDGFPDAFKAKTNARARFLEKLMSDPDIDWAFLSRPQTSLPASARAAFDSAAINC
jgi:putative NADH-flavin reductase